MRTRLLSLVAALALLAGCSSTARDPAGAEPLHILATTYPVYLFTTAVAQGVEGVEVDLLVNQAVACLHDYTLTVTDMKAIEGADVIVMNGAGLEDFMADALAQSDAAVIDCSQEVTLLPTLEHRGHDGHDHEEEYDPHIWMDPRRAAVMVRTISDELSALDPDHARDYGANWTFAYDRMGGLAQDADPAQVMAANVTGGKLSLADACVTDKLITFHDGFQYFADAFGLDLLKAIEEEEGATASAAEIKEIVALIEEYEIPAIFVEKNGSWDTAEVVANEVVERGGRSFTVSELDMLMSGTALEERTGIQAYLDLMERNVKTVMEALS